MAITNTITSTHVILSAEMKSESFIDQKTKVFFMWFDKCFFNIKSKYLETAMGMENSDTLWFF